MIKPIMFDMFCGLGGATEGFLAEGWHCIGIDIERHQYGEQRYPSQLWIQDICTVSGAQLCDASFLWASPPCQEYSYMAMPWSLAKQKAREYRDGTRDTEDLNRLFNACFRIQREACEAAGRHIPMVVENVRGAQPWVGRARWNFGSFYLWGDVPALMPMTRGGKNNGGSWFNIGSPGQKELGKNPVHELTAEGVKQRGSGREWFAGEGKISRMTSSKSNARKAASVMIAKIPRQLSEHIARTYKP